MGTLDTLPDGRNGTQSFACPTMQTSLATLQAELEDPKYKEYRLYFTSPLAATDLELLAEADGKRVVTCVSSSAPPLITGSDSGHSCCLLLRSRRCTWTCFPLTTMSSRVKRWVHTKTRRGCVHVLDPSGVCTCA